MAEGAHARIKGFVERGGRYPEVGMAVAVPAAVVWRDWSGMWRAQRTAGLCMVVVWVDRGMAPGVVVVVVGMGVGEELGEELGKELGGEVDGEVGGEVGGDGCSTLDRVVIVGVGVAGFAGSQYCGTCAWRWRT